MTSARWQATLNNPRGSVVTWATAIDYSNDGGNAWWPTQYLSGSVTCDATSQVRWKTSDLQVSSVDPEYPLALGSGERDIDPFRTRFRVRHGLQYPGGQRELLGMGVYVCTDAQRPRGAMHRIQLSGGSFETYFISPRGAFPKDRTFAESSAGAMVEKLIREVLPRAVIWWHPDIDRSARTPRIQSDGDRWAVIDGASDSPSIARAIGARIYPNGDGAWVVAPPGSLSDPLVWQSTYGETQLEAVRGLSSEGVCNVISLRSQGAESGLELGPVVVLDNDPASPTYAYRSPDEGGFGVSVRQYSSGMFTSVGQMGTAGQAMLAQTLGLRQSISFTRRYDPSIRPGQVGLVDTDAGPLRTIVDSLTYDLSGKSSMDGEARTTSARYTGQVAEWLDDAEGGAGE